MGVLLEDLIVEQSSPLRCRCESDFLVGADGTEPGAGEVGLSYSEIRHGPMEWHRPIADSTSAFPGGSMHSIRLRGACGRAPHVACLSQIPLEPFPNEPERTS